MRQLGYDQLHPCTVDESAGFQINERDSPEGSLVMLGLSYLGLVCLVFYIDYKMQVRRARKRLAAKQEAGLPKEQWFGKDEEDPRR